MFRLSKLILLVSPIRLRKEEEDGHAGHYLHPFSSKYHMLSKVNSETIEIRIGNNSIKPSSTVRNLGVIYDSNLSFKNHITHIPICKIPAT